VDGEWVLDAWIARRDLIATPPRDAWEWRLGLRPWAVFIAQVLQFQAQLAGAPGIAFTDAAHTAPAPTLNVVIHDAVDHAGVPHVYAVYPGAHSTSLWSAEAPYWLRMALNHLS